MMELKIRKIGNASGVILSREVLNRFQVKEGDKLYLTEAPDSSYRITPYDPEFKKQMSLGKKAMSSFRNTLRELAK